MDDERNNSRFDDTNKDEEKEEEEEEEEELVDMDDLLPVVGEFGRYQKLLVCLVCLPACFPCGFAAFGQLFMADVPDHWCKVPDLLHLDREQRKNLSIPPASKCTRYAPSNWTEIMDQSLLPDPFWPTENCLDGWEYDTAEITSSIVIDFDLVCDRDIYPTLGLVALNIGGPIGVYAFGKLNDSVGRKKTFFLCLSTLLIGGGLTVTAPNFWWWAAGRAVVGLTVPAMYQIPFIIALELVGPNYRSLITVLTCTFYTVGLMLLAWICYAVRHWKYLAFITSAPFSLYYFYWFLLPESPRWLLAERRYEEASMVLEKLARVNGKQLPPPFVRQLKRKIGRKRGGDKEEENSEENTKGCRDLWGTPNMRLKTALITLNWFANETVYVGLSYYGPSLGPNEYSTFFLSAAVELPSYFGCWLVMDKWGRRWPICACMLACGGCCLATAALPEDDEKATLILYLISKSAISASFLIIYPFAGELYPTQLRGLGIGTSAYVAGLGLIIVPFITYLGSETLILPLIIMGIISIAGGISGLRLPETLHHKLPQTVAEGEEFGKQFGVEDCLRCVPIRPASSYEELELGRVSATEKTPLETGSQRPRRKLTRQQSAMDTQKSSDGTMRMTYWF